jgi:hypothetical protein
MYEWLLLDGAYGSLSCYESFMYVQCRMKVEMPFTSCMSRVYATWEKKCGLRTACSFSLLELTSDVHVVKIYICWKTAMLRLN